MTRTSLSLPAYQYRVGNSPRYRCRVGRQYCKEKKYFCIYLFFRVLSYINFSGKMLNGHNNKPRIPSSSLAVPAAKRKPQQQVPPQQQRPNYAIVRLSAGTDVLRFYQLLVSFGFFFLKNSLNLSYFPILFPWKLISNRIEPMCRVGCPESGSFSSRTLPDLKKFVVPMDGKKSGKKSYV